MIVMKIRLCEELSGALTAEFMDGINGISQNNSGKNVVQVLPEGFRLAEDEVLRIAFSTSLNEDDPEEEAVGFTLMARSFTDGSWKLDVPPSVSALCGKWYLDLQAASGFNEATQDYVYKRHLVDKLSFSVNATLTDANGSVLTPEDVQSLYESAKSAVLEAKKIADTAGWVEVIEKAEAAEANAARSAEQAQSYADHAENSAAEASGYADNAESFATEEWSSAYAEESERARDCVKGSPLDKRLKIIERQIKTIEQQIKTINEA